MSEKNKTKICKYCRQEIDKKATVCPHCQKKQSGGCLTLAAAGVLLLVLIGFLGMLMSSGDDDDTESQPSVSITTNVGAESSEKESVTEESATEGAETAETENETEPEEGTEEETETETEPEQVSDMVIYDANGITITYKGIEEKITGLGIKVLIENNSDKDCMVQDRDFSLNGFMVDTYFSPDIAAGKKINDEISVPKRELENNDISIDNIETAEFYLKIIGDNFENIAESDIIRIDFKQ